MIAFASDAILRGIVFGGIEGRLKMRVQCKMTHTLDVNLAAWGSVGQGLAIGADYVVYAVLVEQRRIWYFLCAEGGVPYPVQYPAVLFDMRDARCSAYWVANIDLPMQPEETRLLLAPAEWAGDPTFYEHLIDGVNPERAVFEQYRRLMDIEFIDDPSRVSATVIDDGWLQCPTCDDTWEVRGGNISEMVRCPNCNTILLSPYRPR